MGIALIIVGTCLIGFSVAYKFTSLIDDNIKMGHELNHISTQLYTARRELRKLNRELDEANLKLVETEKRTYIRKKTNTKRNGKKV